MPRRSSATSPSGGATTNGSSAPAADEVSRSSPHPGASPVPCNVGGSGPEHTTSVVTQSQHPPSPPADLDNLSPEELDKVIHAAVENLRSALQAWSEVELRKAQSAAVAQTQAQRDRQKNRAPKPAVTLPQTPTATSTTSPPATPLTTTTTATTAAADTPHPLPSPAAASRSSPTPHPAAAPLASSSSTFHWIRDKSPKFWEGMVYTDNTTGAPSSSSLPSSASSTPASHPAHSSSGAATATASPGPAAPPHGDALQVSSPSQTATSVRLATRDPIKPFRNRYKRDVARRLSELLDCDPALGPILLDKLSAESRRLLLVMGTASEYFGEDYKELVEQVKAADKDKDNAISGQEFDQWAMNSFKKRQTAKAAKKAEASHAAAAATAAATAVATAASPATTPVATAPSGAAHAVTESACSDAASTAAAASTPTAPPPPPSPVTPASAKKDNPILKVIQQHPDKTVAATAASSSSPSALTASPGVQPPTSTALSKDPGTALEVTAGTTTSTALQCVQSLRKNMSIGAFALAVRRGRGGRDSAEEKQADPSHIPWSTYRKLLIAAAAPFMAFGFLDNSTLILAGDVVDRYVSESMHLSEMAAAAMGGVVSGVAGIQVHGLAERWTRSAPPALTAAQYRSKAYMSAERIGNTFGMVFGLILGMTPLLFIGSGTDEGVEEDNAMLQKEAARTRQQRKQRTDTVKAETKERGLVEFEERESRKNMLKNFSETKECASGV